MIGCVKIAWKVNDQWLVKLFGLKQARTGGGQRKYVIHEIYRLIYRIKRFK